MLKDAFRKAVYKDHRDGREMSVYVDQKQLLFKHLDSKGCELPEEAKGLILMHHADVDTDEEKLVTALSNGSHDNEKLGKALKKVFPDGKKPKGRRQKRNFPFNGRSKYKNTHQADIDKNLDSEGEMITEGSAEIEEAEIAQALEELDDRTRFGIVPLGL